MIEYLVGGNKPKERLTPNSVPISSALFTEKYSKIIFHIFCDTNTNNLSAIEIDNDIIIGSKYSELTKTKSFEINFENDIHTFDSMEIQEVIKQAVDNRSLYWSNITYLRINYKGQEFILGEKKPVGIVKLNNDNNILLDYHFLTPIVVNNPFFISGIITHNEGICSLQIIELNEKDDEFNDELFYNRGTFGIIEGKNESDLFNLEHMVMDYNVISYENVQPIKLLDLLYNRMRHWTDGRSVVTTYYPKFLSLIDEAMIEREFDVIHSILRLERFLKSIIQRENIKLCDNKKYQEDLGLTTKLYNVWKPLSNSMKLIQKIHNADLELNCYQIAYLSNNKTDLIYAFVTIISQIGLIMLLGLSLLEMNIEQIFPLYEGIVIIPIIFIFTLFIVQKQVFNTISFVQTFPDSLYTFVGLCDIFSNIICAISIVLLNFFVLAFSDSLMDIVLNSLAALFIIELDDSMVFISNNAKDDLYKQKIISLFNQSLKNIDVIYFGKKVWNNNGMFRLNTDIFEVNRELCTIQDNNKISPKKIEEGSHKGKVKHTNNKNIEIV